MSVYTDRYLAIVSSAVLAISTFSPSSFAADSAVLTKPRVTVEVVYPGSSNIYFENNGDQVYAKFEGRFPCLKRIQESLESLSIKDQERLVDLSQPVAAKIYGPVDADVKTGQLHATVRFSMIDGKLVPSAFFSISMQYGPKLRGVTRGLGNFKACDVLTALTEVEETLVLTGGSTKAIERALDQIQP